jgi:signal transduction histidine kinase
MTSRFTPWIDRVRHSALAIPAAVLLAALMVGISEMAYHGAESRLTRLEQRSQARVLLLRALQRVTDAESGKRGHMLAGGDEYLLPYETARQDVQAGLNKLQTLYAHFGDDQAEVRRQRIAELVATKLSEMEEVLRLRHEGRYDAALEVIRSGIGRDVMHQLRAEGDALVAHQDGRVADELADVYDTLRLNRIGVSALTTISLLVLVLLVRQGRVLDRQRMERQAEIQAERDRLEREVLRRTAQLTQLASHLQTAREDERARLARDLHDELGALLTAAKLDVARIKPKLQQDAPDLMPRLAHLTESLNAGIALKRRIIEDLRPSTLSSLGLCPALEILCTEFAERSGLAVDADLHAVALSPSAELTVFRLVQEALTNIAKYAQASRIELQLQADEVQAQVTVRDNGVGFDPATTTPGRHGLLGMRFRVEAEQGQFALRSAPGQGTTVSARLPLRGTPGLAPQRRHGD